MNKFYHQAGNRATLKPKAPDGRGPGLLPKGGTYVLLVMFSFKIAQIYLSPKLDERICLWAGGSNGLGRS